MAGATGVIDDLFALLQKQLECEQFQDSIATCNKLLELLPTDLDALSSKVYSLVQLSQWSAALDVIENAKKGKKFSLKTGDLALERAYCLYRTNRYQDALNALKDCDKEADEVAKLEAQVRYRMGDYKACQQMYERLLAKHPHDTSLLVNLLAAYVSGDAGEKALKTKDLDARVSYEVAFNAACAAIDAGDLEAAGEHLDAAEELCRSELARDNVGEEEMERHPELVPIKVQRAFITQRQASKGKGKTEDAAAIYSEVLKIPNDENDQEQEVDVTVLAVARNNLVALRPEGKALFDSLKRINLASKESLDHKLTIRQQSSIAVNKCIVLLQSHKLEECRRALQLVEQKFPNNKRVVLVTAALLYAEKKAKQSEEALVALIKAQGQGGEGADEAMLALAQLRLNQNNLGEAVAILKKLPKRYLQQASFLSSLVVIQQRARDVDGAVETLEESIKYWTQQQGDEAEARLGEVLKTSAELCLKLRRWKDASTHLKTYLEKIDGTNTSALCGLISSATLHDLGLAEAYAARLKRSSQGLPFSVSRLDPDELEASAVPNTYKSRKDKDATRKASLPLDQDETAGYPSSARPVKAPDHPPGINKRKRKIRYPKNFDPLNPGPPPDPERWLPKYQRAAYRKQYKRRKELGRGGAQGTMPSDDNLMRQAGPSTAHIEASKDETTRRPGNKGAKKKK